MSAVICPKCRTSIKLTKTIAASLIAPARWQLEQQTAAKETALAKREAALRKSEAAIAQARNAADQAIEHRLGKERAAIAASEARKARSALAADMNKRDREVAELQRVLAANNAKLAQAQRGHASLMRKARELDDAKREVELSVEKRIEDSLAEIRTKAKAEAEDALLAKVSERELQISGMHRQIEALRRQAEQGSQQIQGEALEQSAEALLRSRFPRDVIEPVAVGQAGADILHRVFNERAQHCGTLLWEFKRTRAWNERWLAKLRTDQRSAGAQIALLVSDVLPKGVETFDLVDGIWVTRLRFVVPLAIALRQSLIEVTQNRHAVEGQQTKLEMVYQYLIGPQFRNRLDAIVERFADMQSDLDRERRTTTRLWAKRDAQLKTVLEHSAGLFGDIQGIIGQTMPTIAALDVLMIEADDQPVSSIEQ